MSRWQITQPPPGPKIHLRTKRPGKNLRLCNCGRPAVAKAAVRVGFDIPYVVTLYLCKGCLAYEVESQDVLPPISITYLT